MIRSSIIANLREPLFATVLAIVCLSIVLAVDKF